MRIVIPYVTRGPQSLRPEVRETFFGLATFSPVFNNDYEYCDLLIRWLKAGEPFFVVEQDMLPEWGQLLEMDNCPEPWCVGPYRLQDEGSLLCDSGLGCVKFRPQDLQVDLVAALEQNPRPWYLLDTIVNQALRAKHVPHVHSEVVHLHDYSAGVRSDVYLGLINTALAEMSLPGKGSVELKSRLVGDAPSYWVEFENGWTNCEKGHVHGTPQEAVDCFREVDKTPDLVVIAREIKE